MNAAEAEALWQENEQLRGCYKPPPVQPATEDAQLLAETVGMLLRKVAMLKRCLGQCYAKCQAYGYVDAEIAALLAADGTTEIDASTAAHQLQSQRRQQEAEVEICLDEAELNKM